MSDTRLGILMMLLGSILFTVNDALGKWLVAEHAVAVLLSVRSLFAAAVILPFILRRGWRSVFAVRRLPLHLLRVLASTTEIGCFYWAVRYLPLADVMTIYMASPLIVTALSVPLLGESVGWRRWTAVLVGFAGVVLVLNPAGDFDPVPSLVALAGTFAYALSMIGSRFLRADGNLTLVSFSVFGTGLAGAAALPTAWAVPDAVDFLLLGLLGLVALAGHVAVNRSLQLSPPVVVAPFQYISIVLAVVLDAVVWGHAPALPVAAGAALIIASGLFVFHREQTVRSGVAAAAGTTMGPGE
ncbi:DMT family transporter [Azospirillum sp. ST 5-10]|uniref:DMT family transporter n=1 Tax=unclassified Azospirillum TaxID=2630922 RepID=UPI003F4A1D28